MDLGMKNENMKIKGDVEYVWREYLQNAMRLIKNLFYCLGRNRFA